MPLIFTPLVSDGLNGANQNPLAGIWQTQSTIGLPLEILNNKCTYATAVSDLGGSNLISDLPTNNRWAEIKIAVFANPTIQTDNEIVVSLYSSSDVTTAFFNLEITGGQDISGNPSVLVTSASTTYYRALYTPAVGDIWRLATNNGSWYLFKNGAQIATGAFSPSDLVGANQTILYMQGTSTLGESAATNFNAGTCIFTSVGAPTNGTVGVGQFFGTTFESAFTNPENLDVLQVVNEGGKVVWNLTFHGVASTNPASPTNGALFTYFGSSFAQAFNTNPDNLDILQVVQSGTKVIFSVDYQGNAGSH
jgi:hypothetical protein